MRMFIVLLASLGLCAAGRVHGGGSYGGGHGGSYARGHSGGGHGGGHGGYSGGSQNYGPPQPYSFGYTSQDAEGTHGHSQSSDGRRVQGHYVIQLADGRHRKVEYHADETGFHAKIVTNEQGTESKDAADALYQSSAITGEQAALQYGGGSSRHGGSHHAKSHRGGHGGSGFGGGYGGGYSGGHGKSHSNSYSSSSRW